MKCVDQHDINWRPKHVNITNVLTGNSEIFGSTPSDKVGIKKEEFHLLEVKTKSVKFAHCVKMLLSISQTSVHQKKNGPDGCLSVSEPRARANVHAS